MSEIEVAAEMPRPARAVNILVASGEIEAGKPQTEVRLADGRTLLLPTELLLGARTNVVPQAADAATGEMTIPLIEEQLEIEKRTRETGKVILQKHVHDFERTVEVPLAAMEFEVERLPLNIPVDAAPAIRQEGETTIYPVVEERLVVAKQLVLVEELRVTRRMTERRDTRTVSLRREHITVMRTAEASDADEPESPSDWRA